MKISLRNWLHFAAAAVITLALGFGAFAAFANAAARQARQSQKQAAAIKDSGSPANDTFARLKKLEGKWTGRSTKGWTEAITFKTIAQGSVVHESSFDAHPNETMATMYYLDGDRLLLTHYCVSKTQPRLQATVFEEHGRKVTFTSSTQPICRRATRDTWTRSSSISSMTITSRRNGPGIKPAKSRGWKRFDMTEPDRTGLVNPTAPT